MVTCRNRKWPLSQVVLKLAVWPIFPAILVAAVLAIPQAGADDRGLEVEGKRVRCIGSDKKACLLHVDGYPSYNLSLPYGWSVEPYEAPKGSSAIKLSHASEQVYLWIKPGVQQPGPGLVSIRSQLERQTKNFAEIESGRTVVGGRAAAFGVYTGIPPAGGVAEAKKVVLMTDGNCTYSLFFVAPADEFAAAKPAFDLIQSSIALLGNGSPHGARELPK